MYSGNILRFQIKCQENDSIVIFSLNLIGFWKKICQINYIYYVAIDLTPRRDYKIIYKILMLILKEYLLYKSVNILSQIIALRKI